MCTLLGLSYCILFWSTHLSHPLQACFLSHQNIQKIPTGETRHYSEVIDIISQYAPPISLPWLSAASSESFPPPKPSQAATSVDPAAHSPSEAERTMSEPQRDSNLTTAVAKNESMVKEANNISSKVMVGGSFEADKASVAVKEPKGKMSSIKCTQSNYTPIQMKKTVIKSRIAKGSKKGEWCFWYKYSIVSLWVSLPI